MFDLFFQLADLSDGFLFRLPPRLAPAGILLQRRQFLLDLLAAFLGVRIVFFQQRLAFNFELHDASLDLVNFHGQGIDLHAQAGRGLVNQVDGLVGQEAVRDVTVGKCGRRENGGILDAHAVMHFIAFLQPAQNGDGIFYRRLADQHRLESALQCGVFFDVFLVLVERRCADGAQLAPCQRWLEHVGGVHGAFGGAGAHQGVQLVDEEDHLAVRALDLLEHGLEPVFELAAELGPGDERAEVEGDDSLALEALGHVALGDALREALGDRGLADARLADEHGVVLGAARQDLDDAADLLVAADHRVELAFLGQHGQVAAVLLERLVLRLRVLVGDAVRAADLAQRLEQRLVRRPRILQNGQIAEGEQHVLGRDVLVLEALGLALGLLKVLGQPLADVRPAAAADLRKSLDVRHESGLQRLHLRAGALQQRAGDTLILADQGLEQMLGLDRLVAGVACQLSRVLKRLESLLGESFLSHHLWFSHGSAGAKPA